MVKSKSRRVTITATALLLCLGLVTAGSSIVSAGAATKKVPVSPQIRSQLAPQSR